MASCNVRGGFMKPMYADCSRVSSIYSPLARNRPQNLARQQFRAKILKTNNLAAGYGGPVSRLLGEMIHHLTC